MLSESQEEFIKREIDSSSVELATLKDDLFDHFCCSIEIEMKGGKSFEDAYSAVYQVICPNGLKEIERETLFLLNLKKILFMKKFMYSLGLLTTISISLGWLFKLLNWAGGGDLFTYGFLGFVLIFLPLLLIDRYKLNLQKALSERLKIILGFSSALITGLAVFFKIMHLQGADIILILGVLSFSFGFLPFLFFRMYKKSLE
jgi:hypothetical protein